MHVQNGLLMKKMCSNRIVEEQNIDGFYTKTTQKGGFSKLCVKIKKDVIPTYSIFQHVYGKHNLVSFFRPNRILTVELHRSFLYILFFFQEKTLGDISFKLETKIMNFMSVFFLKKKYNQVNSSVVNNMQYNLFTEFGFLFRTFY